MPAQMYSAMGAASLERWRQAPYAPAYHDTGLILTATDGTPKPDYVAGFDVESSRIGYERAKRLFEEGKTKEAPVELPNAAALRRRLPEGDASLPHVTNNCNGYFEALGPHILTSFSVKHQLISAQAAGRTPVRR